MIDIHRKDFERVTSANDRICCLLFFSDSALVVGKLFEEIFYYAFNKGERELVLDDVVKLSDGTFGVELEIMKDAFPSFVHSDGLLCEDRLQQAAWLYQREEDDDSSSLGDCDSLGTLD